MAYRRDSAQTCLPSIGMIGTGYTSRLLVPALRSAGFAVSAAWGNNEVKVKEMAEALNIPFYTTKIDELLLRSDVDLVCVFCPPHLRADVAVKALLIGKNVVCEMPAGLDRLDAQRMVDASQYYSKLLSLMGHELRYLPAFVKMKEMITDGFCGEITIYDCRVEMDSLLGTKYNWLCDHMMGGGALNLLGTHLIDLSLFLIGQQATEVHGVLKTFNKQTEHIQGFRHITSDDYSCFQMKMDKGCFANVSLNTHIPGKFKQEVMVVGDKGRLVVRNGDLYGVKLDQSNEEKLYYKERGRVSIPYDVKKSPPEIYMIALEKWLQTIKKSFMFQEDQKSANLDVVASAAKFEDGFYVRAVLDAIVESNNTHEWVKVYMDQTSTDHGPYWGEGQPVAVIPTPKRKTSAEVSGKQPKGAGKVKEKPSPVTPKRVEKNKL